MTRVHAILAGLIMVAVPGAASAMTAGEFLAKTRALQAKGVFAIGSPDIALLKDEMKGITTAYRADLTAAHKAGRRPQSCPPPKDDAKARLSTADFLAELEAIPPAQRGMSMKAAFYGIMKKRFPCPPRG